MNKKVLWDSNSSLQGLDAQREVRELNQRILLRLMFKFVSRINLRWGQLTNKCCGTVTAKSSWNLTRRKSRVAKARDKQRGLVRGDPGQKQQARGAGVECQGLGSRPREARLGHCGPWPAGLLQLLLFQLKPQFLAWSGQDSGPQRGGEWAMSENARRVCAPEEDFW